MDKKLEVKNLQISFRTQGGILKAVRNISFDLYKGETLAIVGESGSGKSVTSKAIMGILAGNSIVEGGEILYDGQDLLKISEDDFHKLRGDKVAMIFQDPMSSLNPIMRVGQQLTEAMILKAKTGKKNAKNEFNTMLKRLGDNINAADTAAGQSDAAAVAEKLKKFDNFCIAATKIEREFNEAYSNVIQLEMELDEAVLMLRKQKKFDIAEACLKTAIEREPSNIEVYRKLIEIYEITENHQGITTILENCENEDIQVAFAAYKLSEPTVNLEEGTYKNSLTLELKVDTKETIYYTMDGSEPTLNSAVYRKPITLEEGKYTLRAFAVNSKGMISEEIQKKYNIQLEVPSAASVFPDSGAYHEPTDILIEAPVGNTVYYTLDGSIPSKHSRKYTKPFPMRLGKFTLNCVVYGTNGKVSNITTKEYNLNLNTTYEAPEAISAVRSLMMNTGEIYDLEGHALGMEGNYTLNCNEATLINGVIYYLVTKRFQNGNDTITDFEYKYAVNAENIGDIAKAYSNSEGVYTLEAPY